MFVHFKSGWIPLENLEDGCVDNTTGLKSEGYYMNELRYNYAHKTNQNEDNDNENKDNVNKEVIEETNQEQNEEQND